MGRECRGVREPKQKRTSITSKFSVKLVLGVECGALAYAKAHVTAGTAHVKRFRLALRSPQELEILGDPI